MSGPLYTTTLTEIGQVAVRDDDDDDDTPGTAGVAHSRRCVSAQTVQQLCLSTQTASVRFTAAKILVDYSGPHIAPLL
jgi:hypothetical protein